MALTRVASNKAIIIKQTIQGTEGKAGKDGVTEVINTIVHQHEEGKQGDIGSAPEHEVRNGEVRFKNPDGTWGKWVEAVAQQANGGGGLESVKETPVAQASFKITRKSLIVGTNIYGVNFAGDVEFILPSGIDKNIIIVVKDESNDASTNNITVTTENP